MVVKKFLMAAAAVGACAVLAGCGTTIDLNEYMDIAYDGYNTVGKAKAEFDCESLIKDNLEAFGIEDEDDWYDIETVQDKLEDYIDGGFDKEDGLSNGDKVTYTWDVNKDKVKEKYSVNLKYSDVTIDVEGLDEAEQFDPFGYITVSFSGYAPSGKLEISKEGNCPVSGISYSADVAESLSNGDIVKITAEISGSDFSEYCLSQGYIPSETEKTYTVDGLAAYITQISDIPAETMEKMKKNAEDSIAAMIANIHDGCSLKTAECLGYYTLSRKNGLSSNKNNFVYIVYKVDANMKGITKENQSDEEQTGETSFYTYYRYTDIINLADGTCSVNYDDGALCDNRFESQEWGERGFFGTSGYRINGYEDLDTMFNNCVTKQIDTYNYESTVK